MSRPRLLRPMAPDLAALGDQLEAAARRDMRRRRARRQLFLNAAASLAIAVPVAFSVATAATEQPETIGPAGASATLNWTPGYDISWRHIPEKPIRTLQYLRCLDAKDCRAYQEPISFIIDFPPRRA